MSEPLHSLGLFLDGTRADWEDSPGSTTAVQRLSQRYLGTSRRYWGGPGTDDYWWGRKWWETLSGAGRRERLRKVAEAIKLERPAVVDLFGWSRGGDEMIAACAVAESLGVPVRTLVVFDPVPAWGWKAVRRIVPFLPTPRWYERPDNAGSVYQVLAGEEYSRLLRRAVIRGLPLAATLYVSGDHGYSGRSEAAELFAAESTKHDGVAWAPMARRDG